MGDESAKYVPKRIKAQKIKYDSSVHQFQRVRGAFVLKNADNQPPEVLFHLNWAGQFADESFDSFVNTVSHILLALSFVCLHSYTNTI